MVGAEAGQRNVVSGINDLCVQNFTELYRTLQNYTELYRTIQNFTELYRTLLTFVANRSNVAGFCGVLEENETK